MHFYSSYYYKKTLTGVKIVKLQKLLEPTSV